MQATDEGLLPFSLQDRVALVTGASGGIGEVVATTLAKLGATVAISSRSEARLEAACRRASDQGVNLTTWPCDIRSVAAIAQMVHAVEGQLGPIEILVNNAGIDIPQVAIEVTESAWDDIINTNLKGMFFCSQKVGQSMMRNHGGTIINLASEMSFIAEAPYAVYAISKGGVAQLTRALAVEWAPYNIRVNAVAPTLVATPMMEDLLKDNPDGLKKSLAHIPMGRIGQPLDVAYAVAYLASSAAQFVTGTILSVDGGRLAS